MTLKKKTLLPLKWTVYQEEKVSGVRGSVAHVWYGSA